MHIWLAIVLAGLMLSGCKPAAAPDAASEPKVAEQAPLPSAPPAEQKITPSVELGAMLFRRCVACHTIEAGGNHGIGPNLHGIIGRDIGSVPDFQFSDAMKNQAGVWDEAAMDAFLAEPMKNIPGNRMVFGGVIEPADRKALYLYLQQAK